jgi:hypothetical protein
MTRKERLKLAAAGGVAVTLLAALGGCAAPATPEKQTCATGCVTPTPSAELGGLRLYDQGVMHYNGIAGDDRTKEPCIGVKVTPDPDMNSDDRTKEPCIGVKETAWFNVAGANIEFNSAEALRLFEFFENFAEKHPEFNYPMCGEIVPLTVKPRGTQFNWFLINDGQMTDEQWTKIRGDIGKTKIGIQAQYSNNIPVTLLSDLNNDFAKSSCDTSMVVTQKGFTESDPQWQRAVCDSLAFAYKCRINGISYDRSMFVWPPISGYTERAEVTNMLASSRLIILDKETYEMIPAASVLTRK